jgi:hypothetical protein
MNLATVPAVNALNAITALLGGGTLNMYAGTQPASPETALANSNTLLASFTFAKPAFTSAQQSSSIEEQSAVFQPASVQPSANGTVTFARASMATSAWAAGTLYNAGQIVSANSKLFYCLASGNSSAQFPGPNSTSASIQDGSVYWQFLGDATAIIVADFTVGTSGADIIVANTSFSTANAVTITDFILTIPAV